MLPILMPPNIIDHFYLGGARLAGLRGVDRPSPRRPEEWLAASVHRAGEPGVGPSRTADGALFADLVAADPQSWLGFPSPDTGLAGDTGILVKLLDADQRLPVHVHPTRPFAGAKLHSCYGKTEAWFVIAADGADPAVWVGWSEPVEPAELARRVDAQDSEWMLGKLNKITVRPGDGILVPAGTAHAIGAGVFVVEVQEPSDFSILLEWSVTTATRERIPPGSRPGRRAAAPPTTAHSTPGRSPPWSCTPTRPRPSPNRPDCSARPPTTSSGWTC